MASKRTHRAAHDRERERTHGAPTREMEWKKSCTATTTAMTETPYTRTHASLTSIYIHYTPMGIY